MVLTDLPVHVQADVFLDCIIVSAVSLVTRVDQAFWNFREALSCILAGISPLYHSKVKSVTSTTSHAGN